jgi:hypothetical protein
MSKKNIEPCGSWDGDFTWDGYFMRMHMKIVTQKYDMYDPRTWPLLSQVVATENGTEYTKSKLPPEFMVYEQTLMKSMDELRPIQGQRTNWRRKNKNMKNLFRHYPFNYDRNGELRTYPHIPPDELKEWIGHMSHAIPNKTEGVDTTNTVSDDHGSGDTAGDDSNEAAIYEIMKMLDDTDTVPASRVTELEEELDKTRKEKLEATIRADNARSRVEKMRDNYLTAWEKLSTQVRKEISEYKKQSNALLCQERANFSKLKTLLELSQTKHEAAIEHGKKEVELAKQETAAAKQETMVAKQQILKILEEMKKKKQGAGLQKKKAEEEEAEVARKKPKVEA